MWERVFRFVIPCGGGGVGFTKLNATPPHPLDLAVMHAEPRPGDIGGQLTSTPNDDELVFT